MSYGNIDNTIGSVLEPLIEHGIEAMPQIMTALFNEVMKVERSRYLRAAPYERTDDRQDYANGYKPKTFKTRMGALELQVPQVRHGEFYPSCLERGLRSERALKMALGEMWIQGVSTRRVKKITEELCGFEISSTEVSRCAKILDQELELWRNRPLGRYQYVILDALFEKVRRDGQVRGTAVLVAYGVDDQGKRDVLGVSISLSEAEVHWRHFLESLVERGLHGLQLIVSDAHTGLQRAREAVFPTVPWQRCQFHLQQNAGAYVHKKDERPVVASDIRAVFNAPDLFEAQRLLAKTVQKYAPTHKALAAWMEENIPQGLTIFHLPAEHHRRLRTSNMAERVNKEIRRRTKIVGVFPHEQSCLRLISAVLAEIAEEWTQGRVYLGNET